MVQDVNVDKKVWGKYIAIMKGKTTSIKQKLVVRDQVKITLEIMKLHKDVFLTCNLLL